MENWNNAVKWSVNHESFYGENNITQIINDPYDRQLLK